MAWNVMEQLNANAKKAAVGDNTPKAHFRTQDVSINKMYSKCLSVRACHVRISIASSS